MNWSPQQHAIFDFFREGQGHLAIRARAGTGKTSTIVEGITYAPESSILLCAFNKRIADELTRRLRNPNAEARTLHSVGYQVIREYWTRTRVDEDRGYRMARFAWAQVTGGLPDNAPDVPVSLIARLADRAKSAFAVLPLLDDLVDLAYAANIVPPPEWEDRLSVEHLAELTAVALETATVRDGTVDFSDMGWLPVVWNWVRPTYDLVVVDEAQDLSPVQTAMTRTLSAGRVILVGDDKQAMYSWRGATKGALDLFRRDLKAHELPLTVTYRCPKAVVQAARVLCPDFSSADDAPEGAVLHATEEDMLTKATTGDFVLSRLNAPLARLCLKFLRQGTPARIEGRDITKSIESLVKRQRTNTIPELMTRLMTFKERQTQKLLATKRQSALVQIELIADQVETIEALADGLATVDELLQRIAQLFGDSRGTEITLSSIHRAKGLERDRVWLLVDTLYCRGTRVGDVEEANIHYVGLTRAKQTLMLVGMTPQPVQQKEGQVQ